MEFIGQQPQIDVKKIDFSNGEDNYLIKKHGTLFLNTIRCIISDPSNCGKTNVLIGLITHENGLRLYIYSKSFNQINF